MKKKKSLKNMIVFFMVTCWILPILILLLFIHMSYQSAYIERTEKMVQEGVCNSAILLSNRIDEAIKLIQKPSYEKFWEKAWYSFQIDPSTEQEFFNTMKESIRRKFYLDGRFDTYAFYMAGKEEPISYSSRSGYPYTTFQEKVEPTMQAIRKKDSSYPEIHVLDNEIYLVRNVYTVTSYEKYGTLVISMDKEKLMDGFPMEQMENLAIQFNGQGEKVMLREEPLEPEAIELLDQMCDDYDPVTTGRQLKYITETYNGYGYQKKLDYYGVGLNYLVSEKFLKQSLYELYRLVYGMILVFIPILAYAVYFIRRQIENPLGRMVEASGAIRDGKIGTVISSVDMPNEEFEFLADSFNNMSEQVKSLFDSIYNEKLARKDAQIAALQAQINPHFLNNTLEMMNWQARMNQDVETSSMIEALGIVLDHSMNRLNKKDIYLSEELRCADAYLYIMSMRFGQRLKVERSVDEPLKWVRVPQLILQPLLENAIIHGVEISKQGTISLVVHHDDLYLYLDVINTGRPIPEDKLKKIRDIMAGVKEPDSVEKGKHTSIGIRNVNNRIKLVFGEEYGLSITSLEDGRTMSRIILPYSENAQREE